MENKMAQFSLILAHPYEESFNHGIAKAVKMHLEAKGHSVFLHDLCAENFNPVMTREELGTDLSKDALVLQHQKELQTCEHLIVIHPNWWGQPPAILKGWIDRVLRNGVAYRFGVRPDGTKGMVGMLPIQKLTVFTTSNTPNEQEKIQWGDPLDSIWTKYVAGFCCIPQVERINFSPVVSSTPEIRANWIREACQKV